MRKLWERPRCRNIGKAVKKIAEAFPPIGKWKKKGGEKPAEPEGKEGIVIPFPRSKTPKADV